MQSEKVEKIRIYDDSLLVGLTPRLTPRVAGACPQLLTRTALKC